jgi:hypothetical protein
MCYNSEMSFAFASIGVASIAYLYTYKKSVTNTGIQYLLLFYTAMELLQGIQYFFVNQCSNVVNIFLTEIAYLLVLVQPLIWNMFYYFNSDACDKKIFVVAIVSFVVWMIVDVLSRVLYNKTGENKQKINNPLASDKVCTKKQRTHLYWEWTSADFGGLNATFLSYFMIWFIPALFTSQFRSTSILMMALATFSAIIAGFNGEFFTFASLWCYISVPILLCVVFNFMRFHK